MIYVDTSAIVAALTEEVMTARTRAWFERQESGTLAISHWVAVEVASALALKVRTKQLQLEERNLVSAMWRAMRETGLVMLPVRHEDFEHAARMSERYELGLRASDALHVAVAFSAGCTLVSLDKVMASAAPEFGVPVIIL